MYLPALCILVLVETAMAGKGRIGFLSWLTQLETAWVMLPAPSILVPLLLHGHCPLALIFANNRQSLRNAGIVEFHF